MIHISFPADEDFAPEVSRFPAKNFSAKDALLACGDGYEIKLGDHCAIVVDEYQFHELLEAMHAAAPDASDEDHDDKGEEWKGAA